MIKNEGLGEIRFGIASGFGPLCLQKLVLGF